MARFATSFAVCALLLAGCTERQAQHRQTELRKAVLNLYEDQIMDNLIRAQNGYPFIQMDYSHISTQITNKVSTGTSTGVTTTDTKVATPTHGKVLTQTDTSAPAGFTSSQVVATTVQRVGGVTNQITHPFSWMANAEQDSVINIEAVPITDKDQIYDAYMHFLTYPHSLRSDTPPNVSADDPDAVHISRQWNGTLYWVPKQYKDEFLKLSLVSTATRSSEFSSPQAAIVTINKIYDAVVRTGPNSPKIIVKFSKILPFDSGYMIVKINNAYQRLAIAPHTALKGEQPTRLELEASMKKEEQYDLKSTTDEFVAFPDSNTNLEEMIQQITGQPHVEVFLAHIQTRGSATTSERPKLFIVPPPKDATQKGLEDLRYEFEKFNMRQ